MRWEWLYLVSIILIITVSGIVINFFLPFQSKIQRSADFNSLKYFKVMVPFGIISGFIVYLSGFGGYEYNTTLLIFGLTMITIGMFLRWKSILILKNYFTVQVSIVEHHKLVTDGLFKRIRHPSYLGMIIYYLGLGLCMHNWISQLILFFFPLIPIVMRIKTEEKVLIEYFKQDYLDYSKKSWRLIPYIY